MPGSIQRQRTTRQPARQQESADSQASCPMFYNRQI
jgi:hypothetical protein